MAAFLAALAALYPLVRRPILTWGATTEEAKSRLPGDELLEEADGVSTRAITIDAPAASVWPWLAIPDVAVAVESPQRLSDDPLQAHRLLDLVPSVPTPVWGRDEFGAGEMWNSNSVISWLIARSGMAAESIPLPAGGRAPGWEAGIAIARGA
jgi:hypothetical protein